MHRPGAEPAAAAQLDLFYNELYVTLTQRVHVALNALFFPPAAAPDAPSLPDAPPAGKGGEGGEAAGAEAVLKALADEMELTFRLPAAARLHQERVVTARCEPAEHSGPGP